MVRLEWLVGHPYVADNTSHARNGDDSPILQQRFDKGRDSLFLRRTVSARQKVTVSMPRGTFEAHYDVSSLALDDERQRPARADASGASAMSGFRQHSAWLNPF